MTTRSGSYLHRKGNLYDVKCVATHTETKERLVIYAREGVGVPTDVWARPEPMFNENVTADGKTQRRFERVSDVVERTQIVVDEQCAEGQPNFFTWASYVEGTCIAVGTAPDFIGAYGDAIDAVVAFNQAREEQARRQRLANQT